MVTLLPTLGLVSRAEAAAPRNFYGVIPATDPDSSEIACMGAGKVGTLRINFVWSAVQSGPNAGYAWSHYDAIIGAAAQHGIRVLPTVYGSPDWVTDRTNFPPTGLFRAPLQAFRKAKLWITEISWATGGDPTPRTVSPQRQASYMRKSFRRLAANRKRFKIAGVIWYSWRDQPGSIWFNHTGLFTHYLDPEPSWDAFVSLTGGSPTASASPAAQ